MSEFAPETVLIVAIALTASLLLLAVYAVCLRIDRRVLDELPIPERF